jgi:hypothetical protein
MASKFNIIPNSILLNVIIKEKVQIAIFIKQTGYPWGYSKKE